MGKSNKKNSSKTNITSIKSPKIESIGSHDVSKSPSKKSKNHTQSTVRSAEMSSTSKMNDSRITKDQLLEIKKRIEADLPDLDKRSFRVTMAKLDFTKYEDGMDVSGEDMKKQLELLFSKVNSIKNMQEMLNSCFSDIDKLLKVKNPPKDDIGKGKKISTKSPQDYFALKFPDVKDVKVAFEGLNAKKKLKFITKSVEEYVAAHEDPEVAVICKVRKEHFNLYFRSIGMPSFDFKSSFQLYLHEHPALEKENEDAEKNLTVLIQFNKFRKHEDFQTYEQKFKKLRKKFLEEFDDWYPTIPEPLRVHAEPIKTDIIKKMKEAKEKSVPKKRNHSSAKLRSAIDAMVTNSIKKSSHTSFPEEPKMKSSSPKELYKCYLTYNGKETKDINATFSSLPAKDKETFMELAKQELDKYKQDIKDFTDNLPDHDKKIYIGQNRIRFLKLFQGIDIFHSDYPSSEFPAFLPITKEERTQIIKNKVKESDMSIMKELKNFSIMSDREDNEGFTTKKLTATSTPMVRNVKEDEEEEEEDEEEEEEDGEEDEGDENGEKSNGSDEESDDDDDEVEPPVKKLDGGDSGMDNSSSESSSDEMPILTQKVSIKKSPSKTGSSPSKSKRKSITPLKEPPSKRAKSNAAPSSSEDSSSEEDSPPKSSKIFSPPKNKKVSPTKAVKAESSEDSSSDEEALPSYSYRR